METTKKSTFKMLLYLKKNAPKKIEKVTVMCRNTVNGKQSAFSAKLDISASNWDLKYGRVLGKRFCTNLNVWGGPLFRNCDNINKTNQKQSYIIISIFVG